MKRPLFWLAMIIVYIASAWLHESDIVRNCREHGRWKPLFYPAVKCIPEQREVAK